MPTKSRTYTATALVIGPNNYTFETSYPQTSEYIIYSNDKATWKSCRHVRAVPNSIVNQFGPYTYYESCCSLSPAEWALGHAKANIASNVGAPMLEFQRNNKFRIFILVAQIDDLFASFSIKFIRSLLGFNGPFQAYATHKWGLGPILSDFEALMATYLDLRGRIVNELRNIPRSKAFRASIPCSGADDYTLRSYSGSLILEGIISVSNVPDEVTLPIILDEFGFNFRFTDLLDIVPFSFLLSHVVPNITSFLDSQHPSKWFNPDFQYSGWAQLKLDAVGPMEVTPQGKRGAFRSYGYERFPTSFNPGKKPELKWKYPDVRALNDVGALVGTKFTR